MATENHGVAGGAAPSASSGVNRSTNASADSYIGSLISLTSKSEIRYEGVLYNINTDESSIGLKNVRSFGTEGRKKDGQQIPPSDKVYEYILFRGSDIKDLQVKSSPPAQPPPPPPPAPINNDPAIIQQSQYPRPGNTPPSLPSMGGIGSLNDIGTHSSQVGLPGSNFPGNLPLYPPGGLGTWGTSPQHPPNSSGSGMGMPMYWQGYYGPPNGLQHLHQQPLLRPPGLPMTSSLPPPMQYPNFNPSVPTPPPNMSIPMMPTTLPDVSLPMLPPPSTVPFNLPPFPSSQLPLPSSLPPPTSTTSEPLPTSLHTKPLGLLPPPITITNTLPLLAPFISSNDVTSSVSTKPIPPATTAPFQAPAPVLVSSGPLSSEISNKPLAAPGKPSQTVSPPNKSQIAHKDVEVVNISSQTEPLANEPKPPILPLPTSRPNIKPNGGHSNSRYSGRGRDRGRGAGSSNDRAKFTEDFDFEAMNEKFNKDEVWGHLGKNRDGKDLDDDYLQEEYDNEFTKFNSEPVYNKDDFFDNLSSTTIDNSSQNGRTKFSEQMKLDTETFGEFPRNWGGRGGRGPPRGGRYHGGGYGRGGYGYGYGYNGRGRGRGRGPPSRSL